MKNRFKSVGVLFICAFLLSGCTNWLDMQPEDRVTDAQLFSTESGFRTSLNGIYIELNSSILYGGDMLFDVIDVLAQRYDFSENTTTEISKIARYDYTTTYAKGKFGDIWEKSYSLIANCNKILEYADKNRNVLKGETRTMIMGEVYALRAFLHFDLLRLFGPIYSVDPEAISICYNTKFSVSASDLLPAKKVIEMVINDLKHAELLLINDPIIQYGTQRENSDDGLNYNTFRNQRLNFYATKALLARVYLYAGMPTEACEKAKEVIAVQDKWFPFSKYGEVIGGAKTPDRVFSSEILFSLSHSKRNNIFKNKFSPDLEPQNVLLPKKNLDRFFGGERDKDWRYISCWIVPANRDYKCFHKYENLVTSTNYSSLLPLIRISEMHYIIAETSKDEEEAIKSMNAVLYNRGLSLIESYDKVKAEIANEYQKEFWGEGQLFFFYKRMNQQTLFSLTENQTIKMDALKYVIPLPEIETNYR